MTLLRVAIPAGSTGETFSMFKQFRNRRVVLKRIRFTRIYTATFPLAKHADLPHFLSLNLGSWFQHTDESHMHKIGPNDFFGLGAAEIASAPNTNFNTLLCPSSSSLYFNGTSNYLGYAAYDMQFDYDLGIIEHIPIHFPVSYQLYNADGYEVSSSLRPPLEIVFEIS